jgi:hypothetical protein
MSSRAPKVATNQAVAAAKPNPETKAVRPKDQPSFRVVLVGLLKKSKRPLAARELAEQALADGYQTKSKNLTGVVWTALGQMDNVENVPGKGWCLKR